MASAPRISVVIPVFDREAYLGEAIRSVLAQTCADFELLVIDDGSTDRSRDVVRGFGDPRIRLICHPSNLGIARARNTGVDAARGGYLAFLDSDDVAHPTRLEKQADFLDGHPDHAAVGAWVGWMNETGRPVRRIKRRPTAPCDIAALRLFRQGIENSASMARTALLRAHRHDETYAVGEDFDLWSRIAANHPIANLPEILVRRRAHPGQATGGKDNRGRRHRESVYARQLTALGITFDEADLERHDRLRRLRKLGFMVDLPFVEWAEAWLLGLAAANARTSLYPEPAFSEVLAGLWLDVCWCASPTLGRWAAWRLFRSSRLRRFAWPGLRKGALLLIPRPSTQWPEAIRGSA